MDVFFGSSYTMYYGCLVPLLLVKPSRLFSDLSWCLQHSLFTWTTAFLLHWHHYIPSDYLDILHQSALHLGAWRPCSLSVRSTALQAWSPLKVSRVTCFRGRFLSDISNLLGRFVFIYPPLIVLVYCENAAGSS
ncbi:unnamed protein product [Dicrocoelium dendriticum]|nr:unnamed protein product [Dicrocoelium dendriticum]